MDRLPSWPVVIVVALAATVVAVGAQHALAKSAITIAIGPVTAILLALLVSRVEGLRR